MGLNVLSGSLITTTWRILNLQVEEILSAANMANKHLQTAEEGRSFSLEVGRGLATAHQKKTAYNEMYIGQQYVYAVDCILIFR
jgi:hypothetical protein